MVYLIPICFAIVCAFVYDYKKSRRGKGLCFYLLMIYCVIIAGFSYRMGIDSTLYYFDEFYRYPTLSNIDFDFLFHTPKRQPGWLLLGVFCKTLYPSFTLLKVVIAIIVNYTIFITIRRYFNMVFVGILLYFVMLFPYFNFEILRESVAVSIFFWALPYFELGRKKIYYCFVFAAFLFHESSIFLIALPLIRMIDTTKKSVYTFMILALFVMVFQSLFTWIPQAIASIPFFSEKANAYMQSDRFGEGKVFSVTRLFSYCMSIFIPLLGTYYIKKKRAAEFAKTKIEMWMSLIVVYVFMNIFSAFFPIFVRLTNYIAIFYFVYYIKLIDFFVRKFFRKGLVISIIMCSAYVLYTTVPRYFFPKEGLGKMPEIVLYYPYTSVFDESKLPQREYVFYYVQRR